MAKTKKQIQKEIDVNLIGMIIGFLLMFTAIYCAISKTTSKSNFKIIKKYECASPYGTSFKSVCGIVQNNGSESGRVSVMVDYYDSDNIKVDSDIKSLTVDGDGGKAKFKTSGTQAHYSAYRVYID